MTRRPALVVFAKVPRPGGVKTRLVPPLTDVEAADLYDAFLRDALDRYAAWGAEESVAVRLYLDDPASAPPDLVPAGITVHAQAAGALGPRMLRALVETFAAGHPAGVLIGTDHPTLPMALVSEAVRQLETPLALVLGPATDGGYYLLGTGEVVPSLFAMDYSHARVFADTLGRAAEAGLAPVVLPEHDDVDDAASLGRLADAWRAGEDVGPRTARALARLDADGRVG